MNPILIGAYIAEKRKAYNWTQRQLARQLNVTHQAVSRWEQGLALPDIETLVAMSRLFGITVDMLLNPERLAAPSEPEDLSSGAAPENGTPIELEVDEEAEEDDEAAEDEPEPEEPDTPNDFADYIVEQVRSHMPRFSGRPFKSAPSKGKIPRTPRMPHIPKIPPLPQSNNYGPRPGRSININISTKELQSREQSSRDSIEYKLSKLEDLAPFVSKEILSQKFMELISQTDKICPELICELAPFLSREALSAALDKADTEDVDTDFICDIAPFVHGQKLAELISRIEDKQWLTDNFEDLAPYLPRDIADKIFLELF